MPNDLVPQSSLAEQIIERLNLPELIAGPAGKAISRLIGEVAGIPSAWIQRYTQGVKDGTEARSAVSRALALEVAKDITADRRLVERATEVMVAKEVRMQFNREAIAQKTLEHLSDDDIKNAKTELDDDWLNVFSQHAGNASSERLQEIWSRVLAGEIRKASSFSLKTLRFIAELDQSVALVFQKYSDAIVANRFILGRRNKGLELQDLLQLEDFGLVTGVAGTLNHTPKIADDGLLLFPFNKNGILIRGTGGTEMSIPTVVLTQVGREIAQILSPPDNIERAKELLELIPKGQIDKIEYVAMTKIDGGVRCNPIEVLWEKPATTQ